MRIGGKPLAILRIALAFSLAYAAISGFIEPNAWIGFIPTFAGEILPPETILIIFGWVEIGLSIGILFMKNPFYPAILAGLMILGIILFNLSQFDILFRDVPILLIAVVLAIDSRERAKLEISLKNIKHE